MEELINSEKKSNRLSNKSKKVKQIKFNPFSPEFQVNPYPVYHCLRSENPIYRSSFGSEWVLTRYEDVKNILRDRRVCSYDRSTMIEQKSKYLQNQGKNLNGLVDASNKFLLYMNPPDHSRLRALLSQAFSPVVIESMRPQIQTTVDECLDTVRNRGEMDIIGDLAEVLPINVIARMLGVPPHDAQDRLHQWAQIFSRIIDSLIEDAMLKGHKGYRYDSSSDNHNLVDSQS